MDSRPHNSVFSGARYLLRGLRLIAQPGLRRFVVIPLTVNVLVFSLLIWLGVSQFEILLDWMLPEDRWFAFLRHILWPLIGLATLLLVFYSFTTVANLIAAPFNGLLAEQVERYLCGHDLSQEDNWRAIAKDIFPSLWSELRKSLYFLMRAIPLLILFLIPLVNIVAPFLWMAFSGWYLALEYADYPMANHRIRFKEQHRRLKKMRWTGLGFGLALNLLMMLPLINFLAMPAAVAGATLFWHRQLRDCAPRAKL